MYFVYFYMEVIIMCEYRGDWRVVCFLGIFKFFRLYIKVIYIMFKDFVFFFIYENY